MFNFRPICHIIIILQNIFTKYKRWKLYIMYHLCIKSISLVIASVKHYNAFSRLWLWFDYNIYTMRIRWKINCITIPRYVTHQINIFHNSLEKILYYSAVFFIFINHQNDKLIIQILRTNRRLIYYIFLTITFNWLL